MKKQLSKRKLISRYLMIPLLAVGIGFSMQGLAEEAKVNNGLVDTMSTNTKTSDSWYEPAEDVDFKINRPNPMSFDADTNADFTFVVERADGVNWDDFVESLYNFRIVFESSGTIYGEDTLAEIQLDWDSFDRYFTTSATSSEKIATYQSKKMNLIDETGYAFEENEEYQFRISWDGLDVDRVTQYTEPLTFIYGVSAPVISWKSYDGYEQALVEADILLYGKLEEAYALNPYMNSIYNHFYVTWQDQQNTDLAYVSSDEKGLTLADDVRVVVDTRTSEDTMKIYFMFDNLVDGQSIDVDVNYELSQDFGRLSNDTHYSATFESKQYQPPTLEVVDPTEIEIYDFDSILDKEDYNLYGGVTVPLVFDWKDETFPAQWPSLNSIFSGISFTPEVAYREIIATDGITVESIRTTGFEGEELDPNSVSIVDSSNPDTDGNWDSSDPENVTKTTYMFFEDLKLGETYEVTLKAEIKNPELFDGETQYITDTISFKTPDTIDTPKLTITDIAVPTDETGAIINDPTNWTELAVKFMVERPSTWDAIGVNKNLYPEDIFTKFEVLIMEGTKAEDGSVVYDPDTAIIKNISPKDVAFDTETEVVLSDLNSEYEYGIQVNAVVNETFTRIFGIEDRNISSSIISSNTRHKESLPSITLNTDLHDVYEPGDSETEYTVGFYIEDPLDGSWNFLTDSSGDTTSAFYFKNIISSIYVTNVYSDTNPEDTALFNKKFYVNNAVPGNSSASTNLDSLHINNGTNTNENANSITIDGLKTAWNYNGTLVVQLTNSATDAAQGWLDTETNTINIDFAFAPGHPIKAPKVSVEGITTEQTTYDRHSATIAGSIDIDHIEIPSVEDPANPGSYIPDPTYVDVRDYFETYVIVQAAINSDIRIESEGETISEVHYDWADVLPSFADHTGDPTAVEYFDTTTNKYHFEFTFDNLKANTDFELFIHNNEDLGYVEDVLDVEDVFETGLNESLDANDLRAYVTNYEYGNQNEGSNQYENVTLNLNQVVVGAIEDYPDYYQELSKNINSLKVVNTLNRDVVAIFDPETIADLTVDLDVDGNPTGLGDITAVLEVPLEAKQTVNLADYSLVIGTDPQYNTVVPEIRLSDISDESTFTTAGLDLPEIKSLDVAAYKNAIKFDWEVTHLNNIESAKLEIYHKETLSDKIVETVDYNSDTFISGNDDSWIGHAELAGPISGDEYYGVLTITPLSTCESDPSYVNTITSDTVTAAEVFDFEFDVTNVSATTNSIILDYKWAKNTGTIVSDLKFEVVDLYAVPEADGSLPIIYEDEFTVLPEDNGNLQSGSNTVTINNDNLLDAYEIYSNQTYEIDGYYALDEGLIPEFKPISEIMVDSNDMDLLTVTTMSKDDAFVDSVMSSNESPDEIGYETTENSFAFSYNWNNRTISNDINKNVTYNTIRVYKDGVVSDDTMVWESDNLVDTIPGESGSTGVFEAHNGDTQIGGKATVDGQVLEIVPNSKFIIAPYVEYDVYGSNSREFETEVRPSQKYIKIPFTVTEIEIKEEETLFLDNNSVQIGYHFEKATAFTLSPDNYLEIFVTDSDGQPMDMIYNGTTYPGTEGVKIYSSDVSSLWSHNTTDENDFADLTIELDGLTTKFKDSVTIASLIHIENADGSVNETEDSINISNTSDQSSSPFIESSNMGVISRKDVLGEYWDYEIKVQSNFAINNFKDVVISELGKPNTSSTGIEVLDEAQVESEFEYNVYNLYLRVDKTLVEPDAEYNDLTFLVGRYIGVDASNMHGGTGIADERADTSWDNYDWFEIEDFFWLYPPKTFLEILLDIVIWLLIILVILIVIGSIGGTGYYIFRITFSNKKWYPIVETIANEKFAVFTDYVDNFGWTQKFQEYADLKNKNIKELREYALTMNIPITFDLSRAELIKTLSLLTDDEIEKFDSFTDDEIDVKNYEILEHWKVARYKKYHPWIKYKLSKLEEKGILIDSDDRLESIQSQLEYIESERAANEEREKMYEEIKALVADVLDTNTELTSEFSADPLMDFRKELEDKVNAEKAFEAEEEARIKAAVDAEEEAKRLAEEEEQRKKDERNAKEVEAIKTKLAFDYKKIVVSISAYNKGAHQKVVGAEAAREATEKLTLERNKINKLMDIFKAREDKIISLGGELDPYAFEEIAKVDLEILLTPFEQLQQELDGLTKQGLIDKAKELKLDVKVSWSKDKLEKDILDQVKERGDFDD